MRKGITILSLLLLFLGCNNQNKNSSPERDLQRNGVNNTDTVQEDIGSELVIESETEKDGVVAQEKEDTLLMERESAVQELAGTYYRVDSDQTACNCSCLEISFTEPKELCISPDKIVISTTFEKADENHVHIFLDQVLKDEEERSIPWDEFNKDVPIAILSLQPDQTLELDWIGFSINEELAVDYAIFGKKTLEGTYKKR